METIRYAVEDGIATLTLDYPARKNALNGTMRREIGEVIHGLRRDSSVRALILTGAGTELFRWRHQHDEGPDQRRPRAPAHGSHPPVAGRPDPARPPGHRRRRRRRLRCRLQRR